jgi:hypothetical protein
MTDADAYAVELEVPAGLSQVSVSRSKPAGRDPARLLPVQGSGLKTTVALEPGKNVFMVYGIDARGRKVKGPSFQIFRTSKGPSDGTGPVPAPSTGASPALPYLQPASPPKPVPPPKPPVVREYGEGRCGYPMNQRMSIPVTDAHGTRYVEFTTDHDGCLPPEVELK